MKYKLKIIEDFFHNSPFQKINIICDITDNCNRGIYFMKSKLPEFTINLESITEKYEKVKNNLEILEDNLRLSGFNIIYSNVANKSKIINSDNMYILYRYKITICVGDCNPNDAQFIYMNEVFDRKGNLINTKHFKLKKYN